MTHRTTRPLSQLGLQALAWLRAEFDDWSHRFAPERPETRRRAAESFRVGQKDAEFGMVRDPQAVAALPADERAAWQAFWTELEAGIEKAESERPGALAPPQQ